MQGETFDFQRDVIEASKATPVVIDFWAAWCAPCRILGPVLEKLADEANGAWELQKIDTEAHPQIAMEYRIQGIPAVKMFSNGEVIAEFVGALPELQVKRWLDENIPTESKKMLAEANAAIAVGDHSKAKELLGRILDAEPDNFDARILFAELIFEKDPAKALELVADTPEEHPLFNRGQAIQILAELMQNYEALAQRAAKATESPESWTHYLSGVESLRRQDYDGALESWIASLVAERNIDDDGPRKACVALFTWLGQEHELTKKHHRTFTSALF